MAAEDIRVLVPRVRRAIEGVGTVPAPLTDDQIKDLVADAIANVILFTGGVFGKDLLVTQRDATTNAPTEYATSEPLTLPEGSVVAYEAAIDHLFLAISSTKITETIRDEGQEWAYSISANLLRDMLAWLIEQRDKALGQLGPMPSAFYSFLHERDAMVADVVEPFVLEAGAGGGQQLIP